MKSGSDGIETTHLKSEDLVQTGDENWEHQLKLKDDEMSCLLEKLQTKERELNEKIQVLENKLQEERNARKELELLIEKKAFSIETVKDGGSISDKELTQKSGLIEKPQYGDVIINNYSMSARWI